MGLFVDLFGLNIALLSVLVLIFAWILHKRRTAQIQLWFLGWLLLLVNAALGSSWQPALSAATLNALRFSALAVAGSLFVVALSSTHHGDAIRDSLHSLFAAIDMGRRARGDSYRVP